MSEGTTETNAPQALDAWFLDLLACPACPQHLPLHRGEREANGDDTLVCQCGRYAYPVRDGLPILIVEEARVLNENARPEDVVKAEDAGEAGAQAV